MNNVANRIKSDLSQLNEYCDFKATSNSVTGSILIEIEPSNESGKENISLVIKDNHITLGFDYYERRFEISANSENEIIENLIDIINDIFTEKLISVTHYSADVNISKVSRLYKPADLKTVRRHKNFRSRSWNGSYDDENI